MVVRSRRPSMTRTISTSSTGSWSLPSFFAESPEIEGRCRSAGLAAIPGLAQTPDVLLPHLALELPVTDSLTDDLACGGIFPRVDGRLERKNLFAGQSHADFPNVRHGISLASIVANLTTW